ncbi:hypothetical protein IH785_05720 [candidate division KSB1 bacterium]|nr:hypothetical protein [candidate division KSB1 bacterium]
MQITEPTTMITDYLLGLFTVILAVRLFKLNENQQENSIRLWGGALAATAIAAFLGGTSHGFALHFSDFAKTAIWKATVYSIGLASFFMLSGTLFAAVANPLRKLLLGLVLLKFLIYAGWMVSHDEFKYVIFDYAPAMLGVVLLQLYAYSKWKHKSAVWLISGVLISFAAAGIQMSGFTLHQHFNHNDLYHVIQMGAIYLLYRGAGLLKDQS